MSRFLPLLLVLTALLWPAAVTHAAPLAQTSAIPVNIAPSISSSKVQQIVNGTPLEAYAAAVYSGGQTARIDPALALAMWTHESSLDTAGAAVANNNPGNLICGAADPTLRSGCDSSSHHFAIYPSLTNAITDWYAYMNRRYVNLGLTTVEAIIPVYAPAADGNDVQGYISSIHSLYTTWGSTAVGGSSSSPTTAPCVTATMAALSKQGAPYVWGAKGPNSFDCSGLTYWAYQQAGVTIDKSTAGQIYNGAAIPCTLGNLNGDATTCWAPGDLVFLSYPGGQHVALYAGHGQFMDCYNENTGCFLHDVTQDNFYLAHFWQARRIVAGCEGSTIDPGTPTYAPPAGTTTLPAAEQLPDIVGYASFQVPDPALFWPAEADPGWSFPYFGWLAWRIRDSIRVLVWDIFCLAQYILNAIALATNLVLAQVNGLYKLLIELYLWARSWMIATYAALVAILVALGDVGRLGALLQAWIDAGLQLGAALLGAIGELLTLVLTLVGAIVGVLGWVGGLAIGLVLAVLTALDGTSVPVQLSDTDVVYELVHGFLQGIRDGVGWLFPLLVGLAYVGFLFWLTRYFQTSGSGAEE